MFKKPYFRKKIDAEKYVNVETGELLDSEYNVTSVNVVDEDLAIVSSKEYVIIDSRALAYVFKEFTEAETGRILRMVNMVKGCYNLLYDRFTNTPHTKDTLAREMGYNRNRFNRFMKKLHEKSIICYMEVMVNFENKKKHRWIMLNPVFARKQKTFHKDCLKVFVNLSETE